MSAEFILRSLFDPAGAKVEPLITAIQEVCKELLRENAITPLPAADLEERMQAYANSLERIRRVLYSRQCGYFADPYNQFNLLSICGLGEMRIYGVRGAPGDGAEIDDIVNWTQRHLQNRKGWELLDSLVKGTELSPACALELLDKLWAAYPLLNQRLARLSNYMFEWTAEQLGPQELEERRKYFLATYADLCSLLELAIEQQEALVVLY